MNKRLKVLLKNWFLKMGLSVRFAKHVGEAESSFLNLLKNNIDCVLYVGANKGQMVPKFVESFPGVPIIMYEPDPELAKYLTNNFNIENVSVINKAVGSHSGTAEFHISSGTDGQSSSLLPMGQRHLKWSPESAQDKTIRVETTKLDNENLYQFQSIFLKIDIQGFELEALKGATKLIDNIVAIDVEVSSTSMYDGDCSWIEVSNFLNERKFELFDIDPWFHDHTNKNELLQADFRFAKKFLIKSKLD